VIGAGFAAERSGVRDFVSLYMGGTSNGVAVVRDGKPLLASEGSIGPYPVRTPMVDVNTIGAGGGSIAWIDAAGGLRVGPRSAGAEPGPACYGRGGEDATVTDASVVLGYLNPARFAGGALALDVGAAERAVAAIAKRLGVDTVSAAAGIHRVINARMADQIRLVTIKRGDDPRQFALVVLGGAGPVHGAALAEEMGMAEVLVPEAYEHTTALGGMLADGIDAALRDAGLPWTSYWFGPRAGQWYGPHPRTGADAHAMTDPELTRLLRIWMANRGIWEALPGAGPTVSVPASSAEVDRYLTAYTQLLVALTS